MKPKIILLCLVFVFLRDGVYGQFAPEDYLFKTLEEDSGLSNSNVLSILKDREGFLWFGTANGLNRFDGTKMRTFYTNERDSTSLSNSYISRLYQGPEGNIWVKNMNGEFNVYVSDQEYFQRNIAHYTTLYGLKSDKIRMVMEDAQGRFWFAHPFEGISIYDSKTKTTQFLSQNSSEAGNLSFNHVSSLSHSRRGEVWVVFQNGAVDVLDATSLKVTHRLKIDQNLDPAISYDLEIFVDSDHDAWIYAPDHNFGLIHIGHRQKIPAYYNDQSAHFRLNNNMVKSLIEHQKGEIWAGTDHGGINVLDKKSGAVHYIMHNAEISRSLSHNAIYALYKDNEDIIWIGTYKKGLNYYHQGMMRFSHIQRSFGSENSLPYNDVNTFVEDSLGNFYIGTNGDGMYYHDREAGTFTKFAFDPLTKQSLVGDVIVDLSIDQDGVMWIGTYLNGLFRYDGKDFFSYLPDPNTAHGLNDVNIWKIYVDSKNRVWIGTLREGLHLYDRNEDHFRHFPVSGQPFHMNNRYITSFAEDKEGNLWVGGGYGIDVINLETEYHHYFSAFEEISNGLLGNNISELLLDSNGVMWVTTSQGLNYFDSGSKTFMSYSRKDGLPSDYTVSILEDDKGNFWLSTQNGLTYAVVDRTDQPFQVSFRNFDEKDGLQAAFFNKNAALKTNAGEFVFGGPNGYNIFQSENFAFELNDPKVIFTGFQLFNKPLGIGEESAGRIILPAAVNQVNEVELKHFENIFSIEFSAMNFINSEKNKFRYKLRGFNEEWTTIEEPPFRVTYTNLNPGTYELIVQPIKNDGQWSQMEYPFTIKISAPFWKTPIAYSLYAVLVILLALLARKLILSKEREKFKRLEEKREALRIQELDKLKTKFFTNVSHEFRTPLTLILTPVEKMLKKANTKDEEYQFQTIQRNAKRLLQLVNQLLDVKNIEKEGVLFNPVKGDLIRFIAERVYAFAELSEKKHIQLDFKSELNSFYTAFDPDKLEKVIFNLLSNAFKFTPHDGHIKVEVLHAQKDQDRGLVTIRFQDTGIGIPDQDLPKIFERYYTSEHQQKVMNQGSGIGLSLALEFTKLHGGDIAVSSEVGKGTTFLVSLHLPDMRESALTEDAELEPNEGEENHLMEEFISEKPTLLLVEDHDEFRFYLQECLNEDYQILLAADGREGVEKAMRFIPDLVISDLMMPLLDGVGLCQSLKSDIKTSHIPVIILTARSSEEKHLEGIESGCNLFIRKPFNLDILQSSIRNLLQERERLQNHYRKKISINTSEQEIVSLDDRLIQKAIQLVEDQMENSELSVEQMSRELGMSRVHLYKKLSSLTGKSPVEFIRMIRLQRAAQLLVKSQLTVAEVAYKVGYNNAKYFSKHFKSAYGTLPSAYAAQHTQVAE